MQAVMAGTASRRSWVKQSEQARNYSFDMTTTSHRRSFVSSRHYSHGTQRWNSPPVGIREMRSLLRLLGPDGCQVLPQKDGRCCASRYFPGAIHQFW